MKDKSAFEESVFNKSNIIFARQKKRRKTIASLTASALCFLFVFTLLLHSPVGFENFAPAKEADMACIPETEASASGMFYNKNDEGFFDVVKESLFDSDKKLAAEEAPQEQEPTYKETPASTQAAKSTAAEATKFPVPADSAPVSIEITVFDETVSVYKGGNDMEYILHALEKYFDLEEKSEDLTAEISVVYSVGDSRYLVGQEFFDILSEIKD